uniref:Uncharacterized protein n=1 Tax=Parascaris equorum TaxID=6256 RepID=A0A914RT00_PAREQ
MGVLPPATHMQRAFSTPHIHAELTSPSEMISQQQQSHRGAVYPESSMGIPRQSNETAIPELADSQMKNLMDQFGPGNPLSDLGDGCLDGVLAAHSEHDEQPSTIFLAVYPEILGLLLRFTKL